MSGARTWEELRAEEDRLRVEREKARRDFEDQVALRNAEMVAEWSGEGVLANLSDVERIELLEREVWQLRSTVSRLALAAGFRP